MTYRYGFAKLDLAFCCIASERMGQMKNIEHTIHVRYDEEVALRCCVYRRCWGKLSLL